MGSADLHSSRESVTRGADAVSPPPWLADCRFNTNVEFMWLAHGHRIDHSTLADFRKNNASALKKVHADLVRLAKVLGIIKIAELYVDASRIKANASRSRMMTAAKATELLKIVDQQIEAFLEVTEAADLADELLDDAAQGEQLPGPLADLQRRKEQLEQMAQTCREMDAIRKKNGVNPDKNPFQLPITDPDSRIIPNKEGGYAPNYTPLIAVEGELGMIVSMTVFNSVNEQDYLIATVESYNRLNRQSGKVFGERSVRFAR